MILINYLADIFKNILLSQVNALRSMSIQWRVIKLD